jgi:hypothetical protein
MKKPRSIRTTRFILIPLLLVAAAGCATPRTLAPMSTWEIEALRARLGTIGVAGARHLPQVEVQTPSKGALHGALDGATVGALTPIVVSFQVIPAGCNSAYCLFIPAAGLALAPVGAVVGAVGGALTADPAEKVAERSAKINDALVQLRVQEKMRDEFLARLSDVKTFPFTVVHEAGPATIGENPDYRRFQSSGIGSINEIDVTKIKLIGTGKVQPQLHVQLQVQSRLVSTADNAEIYCKAFTCSSKEGTFEIWAAEDAKKFREEIEACYHDLADWLVTDQYMHDSVTNPQTEPRTPVGTATRQSTAGCR